MQMMCTPNALTVTEQAPTAVTHLSSHEELECLYFNILQLVLSDAVPVNHPAAV